MKALDRWLQRWRIRRARPHIPAGARVLDVGCADGALFRVLGARIAGGVGLDPALGRPQEMGNVRLLRGRFPEGAPLGDRFDVLTMLAVFEHVPEANRALIAQACAECLMPGGHLIATVPSPLVDRILAVLKRLRLVDGLALEQHHGFNPGLMPRIFAPAGFRLVRHRRFQFGLNHLFVFRKEGKPGPSVGVD